MSALRLREAAVLLRERAMGARPETPWYDAHDLESALYPISDTGDPLEGASEFIALMSPPVALALADWLEATASTEASYFDDSAALAVADAVLGIERSP